MSVPNSYSCLHRENHLWRGGHLRGRWALQTRTEGVETSTYLSRPIHLPLLRRKMQTQALQSSCPRTLPPIKSMSSYQ